MYLVVDTCVCYSGFFKITFSVMKMVDILFSFNSLKIIKHLFVNAAFYCYALIWLVTCLHIYLVRRSDASESKIDLLILLWSMVQHELIW